MDHTYISFNASKWYFLSFGIIDIVPVSDSLGSYALSSPPLNVCSVMFKQQIPSNICALAFVTLQIRISATFLTTRVIMVLFSLLKAIEIMIHIHFTLDF